MSVPNREPAAPMPPVEFERVYRVLDANLNRAGEGLRVLEEYTRFVLDDLHLTQMLKELRHTLGSQAEALGRDELLAVRNTAGDVGTRLAASDEYQRAGLPQLLQANQKRVEQSLRCLEEYCKLVAPQLASAFEQLRYRFYVVAQSIDLTSDRGQQLEEALLYVLIDGRDSLTELEVLARQLVGGGVDVLQLRDKRLDDRRLLERARMLRQLTRGTSTLLIVNDRPDIAALADADGVHVGQEELCVQDVRCIVGSRRLIGVSTHNLQQARQAVLDGADYIGCGPTFPSRTKQFEAFPGLDFLRQAAAEIHLPLFAIGGINLDNLDSVLETGVRRVAMSAAVTAHAEPAELIAQLYGVLRRPATAARSEL